MSAKKLYIEYRVYFDPNTNQEILDELADAAQDVLYDTFNGVQLGEDDMPSTNGIIYEIILEVPKPKLIIDSDFEFRQEPK